MTRWVGMALLLGAGAWLQCAACLAAQVPTFPAIDWSGDARMGYFGSVRYDRDGTNGPRQDRLASRVRLGMEARLTEQLAIRARAAGLFATDQDRLSLYLGEPAPTVGGLAPGQVTLDELYVDYRPSDRWAVMLGRLQTRADRMGLVGKSLDRKDSGNTRVTWTDGARVTYSATSGWTTDLIVQYNGGDGPPNVARPPLVYGDGPSRVTLFGALGTRAAWGPVVQRGVAVTYIPGALPGAPEGEAMRDYVAFVGRGAVQVATGGEGRRLIVAGEVGYAPTVPHSPDGEPSRPDGRAFHVSATVYDAAPGHHVGVVYGLTDPGWLISPDYRPNGHLAEARYQWRFTSRHSMETRVRWRQDHVRLAESVRPREDLDAYVRLSMSF